MRYFLFAIIAVVVFTVFVTVFAASADAKKVRALPKWAWLILCLVVPPVGGLLYLAVGRPITGSERKPRTRTVAPDDDPQFLRDLAERLKNEGKEGDEGKGEEEKPKND